ncbi:MAG: adenosine kinase [Chitinispirillales bacterium]|jgi:sugar/nucleoside kinase (ribokinase family)|nr:adenosine kinase [Chitinispirillales bacterium]
MKNPFTFDSGKKVIAGIGSALVDLCLAESEGFVKNSGAQMGGMVMVDCTHIEGVLAKSKNLPTIVPGGSACNTIVGIGKLCDSVAPRFIGKRGDDDLGRMFEKCVKYAGVDPVLLTSPTATGRVLSIITPDAQRSMLTYLGASAEIQPDEIKASYFEDCAVVHIEGYLLFNPDVMMAALKAVKSTGALISLDLASYTVVESSRDLLKEIVAGGHVDILIGNEDEVAAFTGLKDEYKAATALGDKVPIGVMKLGKRGSIIISGGAKAIIPPYGDGRPAIDTTGAGDLWASGFLYGLVSDYDLERCGNLASRCGYEVCQIVGAHIPDDVWEKIRA